MQYPSIQESTFSAEVSLDRHSRSAYSGSGAVALTDPGVRAHGAIAELLFPAGTATSLSHPWALVDGSQAFDDTKNCMLRVLALPDMMALAALTYVSIV